MRGYQKRVVFLRNPDSTLFDEAYFVLRETAHPLPTDRDMVAEATRILEGEGGISGRHAHTHRSGVRFLRYGGVFLLGAVTALGLLALFVTLF